MSFLRRLLRGEGPAADGTAPVAPVVPGQRGTPAPAGQDEVTRERELMLADARRLDDDLIQRQLRYADRSWTPPAQGGTRRADDVGAPEGE